MEINKGKRNRQKKDKMKGGKKQFNKQKTWWREDR
jgi:hypothetical protein